MNKICDMICNKILMNKIDTFTEDEKAHLANCPECRMMADQWQVMKNTPLPEMEPPKSIEFVIKREAQRAATDRQFVRRSVIRWASIASIAACAVFIFWMSLNMLKTSPEQISQPQQFAEVVPKQEQPIKPSASFEQAVEQIITEESIQLAERSNKSGSNKTENTKATKWDNVDFSDQFMELEAEIVYCQTSI